MAKAENINISSYLRLIKNLNLKNKMKIISFFSESIIDIDREKEKKEIFDLYRKFISKKDADTIINEIYNSREFSERNINL
jgi:predicted glycosyltransferase